MFPFRSTKASVVNLLGWWEQHFQKLPSYTYPCSQSLIEIPCAIYLIFKKMLKKFKTMLENTLIPPTMLEYLTKIKKRHLTLLLHFKVRRKNFGVKELITFEQQSILQRSFVMALILSSLLFWSKCVWNQASDFIIHYWAAPTRPATY